MATKQDQQKGNWGSFHQAIARAFEKHPNEVGVIKEHLLKQVRGQPNLAKQVSPQNLRQMLIEGSDRHHELLSSVISSDRCWSSLEILSADIQKDPGAGKFTGNPLPIFVAAVIGGLVGIDFCIWEAVATGGDGGLCL